MNLPDQKISDGSEKAPESGERSDAIRPSLDRRKALKLIIASAPVVFTFTAGVAKADAKGYTYISGNSSSSSYNDEAELEYTGGEQDTSSSWMYPPSRKSKGGRRW